MRYIAFLIVPFALAAQPAPSDTRVTEALIKEVQQLRIAIERSTLLGARTQLALSQLQMQDATAVRLTQQYNDVHNDAATTTLKKNQIAQQVKDVEQKLSESTNPQQQTELKDILGHLKYNMEEATAVEAVRSQREGELAVQLQAAQAAIAESRSRIAEMERALDAAIQQLLKDK